MADILRPVLAPDEARLNDGIEEYVHFGAIPWDGPEGARTVGAAILAELAERHGAIAEHDDGVSGAPEMPEQMPEMAVSLLGIVGRYAGLPTRQRREIILGFVDAAAEAGLLGGYAEPVKSDDTDTPSWKYWG